MEVKKDTAGTNALKTPVLLIIFNRPDTTRQVWETIRQARPEKLYVAADGPRMGHPTDSVRCADARAIVETIDWPCELTTWFREENVGCGQGPASGISWFFEKEERGIILEDDILPEPDFFLFCQEMLEKYRDDTRIFQVSGLNPLHGWPEEPPYSYFFTRTASIWGWATWRRAWQHFDFRMSQYPAIEQAGYLRDFFYNQPATQYMMDYLRHTYRNPEAVSWWDYQWMFTRFIQSGLCIVPHQNLIQNIGFGEDATHTQGGAGFQSIPTGTLSFPLRHPAFVLSSGAAERRQFDLLYARTFREKAGATIRKGIAAVVGKARAEILWAKLRGKPRPELYA